MNNHKHAEWSRYERKARRGYYNCSSFAIYLERGREHGTNGPTDPGEIVRVRRVGIYATMEEAQRYVDWLRNAVVLSKNEFYSVTERLHDEHGKIIDQMMDEYRG